MKHVESAPPKINLSLRVLGRREDGFHEVETLMVPLRGIADRLAFDLEVSPPERASVELACDDPALPTGEQNLVSRAVAAFSEAVGVGFRGEIQLEKRVPSGAGLGGGSSDAAATLRALNRMSEPRLSATRLSQVAAALGSDVPFFIDGLPAVCRGRGEQIARFPGPIPRTRVLLVKPGFGVASAWAYSRWADALPLPGVRYAAQHAPWGEAVNDLERPVFEKYLLLATLKRWMAARGESGVVLMSGSGATVFATLRKGLDGAAMSTALKAEFGDDLWCAEAEFGGAEVAAEAGG